MGTVFGPQQIENVLTLTWPPRIRPDGYRRGRGYDQVSFCPTPVVFSMAATADHQPTQTRRFHCDRNRSHIHSHYVALNGSQCGKHHAESRNRSRPVNHGQPDRRGSFYAAGSPSRLSWLDWDSALAQTRRWLIGSRAGMIAGVILLSRLAFREHTTTTTGARGWNLYITVTGTAERERRRHQVTLQVN